MGVLCCYFRPKMFFPGDHVRYHSRTLGAHVLASVEGATVCLEIPLQSLPPPRRPSHANPGVCKGGAGYYFCCLLATAAKPGRPTLDTKKGYKTKTGSTSSVGWGRRHR